MSSRRSSESTPMASGTIVSGDDVMRDLPEGFTRRMVDLYEAEGVAWLHELPTIIARCAQRWSIKVHAPFIPLSYNYVAPATRADGADVVLKIGYPNNELMSEIEALRLYAGRGIVQLLEADA